MNRDIQSTGVTVVIPCRNHSQELKHCLDSLEPQVAGTRHRILVVAGGEEPAGEKHPANGTATIIRCRTPLLAGAARNRGAAEADGEILAFIDADCIALPGWVEAAAETLRRGARLAGGPILDRWPLHPIAAADNLLQFVDFGPMRRDGPVGHMPSCNLAIRRSDFEAIGGFPEDVPFGHDVILVRNALSRWPEGLHYSRAMRVRHQGRRTPAALWSHQYEFGRSRAIHQLMTKQWHLQAGVWSLLLPFGMAWKFFYTMRAVIRYRPFDLARLPLLLPMMLVGLAAYGWGFRDGCRALGRIQS